MNIEDVIIIGAGPGGLATALQLERYGINPLIIEQERVGGVLHNANLVENYPGFPGGISGPELVNLFAEQVKSYALRIKNARAEKLDYVNNQFQCSVEQLVVQSRIAVIASGTKPRLFNELSIPTEVQNRVFYEIYTLLDVSEKRVAIVGAGDAAFDYALNLGQHNEILVLNRGTKISCLPLLWERALLIPRIQYYQEISIFQISPAPSERMLLGCKTPNGSEAFVVDYLIGAIGRDPNLDFISGQFAEKAIQLESSGELYYVGDVVNSLYRQTAIAVGDGILTAMKIYKHLKENY